MKKALVVFAFLSAQLALLPRAFAQEKADSSGHPIVLSAERLFAVSHNRATAGGHTDYATEFNVFTGQGIEGSFPYLKSQPRLALDVFLTPKLSLGGAVGGYYSTPPTGSGENSSSDDRKKWGLVGAARFGYAIQLGEMTSFWPRLGVTYSSNHHQSGSDISDTVSLWQMNVEAMFFSRISRSVPLAFVYGPVLDYGFHGKNSVSESDGREGSTDFTTVSVAFVTGLAGYL